MNPYAGMRKASKMLPEILAEFNRADYDVHAYMTKCRGDGKEEVKRRAAEMDLIVCCGGDGTFNETVAGLLENGADVPVGYIPAGSTNDFASSMGISMDPRIAAKSIIDGKAFDIDIGYFNNERYFSYIASF